MSIRNRHCFGRASSAELLTGTNSARPKQIVPVYVGLDYHSDSIRVCVLEDDGAEVLNRSVRNDLGEVCEMVHCCLERRGAKDRARRDAVVQVRGVAWRGVAIKACTGSADFATRLAEYTEWPVKLAHAGAVHRLKQGPDKTT